MKKYKFNWTSWFWAIVLTISIISGIKNFDSNQIILCCLVLLPVCVIDILFIKECILEIIYMLKQK